MPNIDYRSSSREFPGSNRGIIPSDYRNNLHVLAPQLKYSNKIYSFSPKPNRRKETNLRTVDRQRGGKNEFKDRKKKQQQRREQATYLFPKVRALTNGHLRSTVLVSKKETRKKRLSTKESNKHTQEKAEEQKAGSIGRGDSGGGEGGVNCEAFPRAYPWKMPSVRAAGAMRPPVSFVPLSLPPSLLPRLARVYLPFLLPSPPPRSRHL
jgi:hypothetical protein